jgi:hypothetical protein
MRLFCFSRQGRRTDAVDDGPDGRRQNGQDDEEIIPPGASEDDEAGVESHERAYPGDGLRHQYQTASAKNWL